MSQYMPSARLLLSLNKPFRNENGTVFKLSFIDNRMLMMVLWDGAWMAGARVVEETETMFRYDVKGSHPGANTWSSLDGLERLIAEYKP